MRRQPLIVFAALIVAGGAVLAWPTLSELARTPVPVGAVLPGTGAPVAAGPLATVPLASTQPTPAATETPAPTETPAATETSTPTAPAGPSAAPGPTALPTLPPGGPRAAESNWHAFAPMPPDPGRLSGYRWPLVNGVISQPFGTSPFGALLVDGQRFHDGLDIASFCGDSVVAAHDGLVLAAGRRFDPYIGWVGSIEPHTRRMNRLHKWWELPITVIVDDGDGYRAIYAHFNAVAVRAGDHVHAGQRIGWEGSTGFATGCHVHFGLFSPFEAGQFELRPDVQKRTRYPAWEIARIDPLLVLPPLRLGKTSGPFPSPSPSPTPSPVPTP